MGDAKAVTDLVISLYRNVPAMRSGVCRICRTGPNNRRDTGEPFDICSSCDRTMGEHLYRPTKHVVPISLAVRDGDDNELYKVVARKEAVRASTSWLKPENLMAATVARFYEAHETCLTGLARGPFTLVTSVPSTRLGRPIRAFHILPQIIGMVSALKDRHKPLLVANDKYARVLAKRDSHRDSFQVMGAQNGEQVLRGERVLLLDDLFVSGAHVQSAASALFEQGAEEVVALVILRLIVPSPWHDNRVDIWQEASAQPFNFDRCCLCDPAGG
ncbi:hypothetical protein OIE66_00915 [Nonomuraea sp. NBC_01738]|uniref:hypothetical protein n=1 Tax=Nonomuraea sp. NBC_01738 TaxID=2976003 RepID=UPI002E0FC618|nr:hypothetical protein OIE66_00915 [Nonomuraea sp. NBC_01738]